MTDPRTPTDGLEAHEASAAALAAQLDALRIAAGKTDALAATTVESYDHADWSGADRVLVERLAYLIGTVAEAARETVTVVDRFHGFVADLQRSGVDEWW